MFHPAHAEHVVGQMLQFLCAALHDDDLKAIVFVKVDVCSSQNVSVVFVLQHGLASSRARAAGGRIPWKALRQDQLARFVFGISRKLGKGNLMYGGEAYHVLQTSVWVDLCQLLRVRHPSQSDAQLREHKLMRTRRCQEGRLPRSVSC